MTCNSLWQGTWIVMSYRSGDEMVIPDDRTEASFTIDGTLLSDSMGVNRFNAEIGSEFPIGTVATTRMAGPPELMRLEDTIPEHLQEGDTSEVIEDGMTLSRDGLSLVELERMGTGDRDCSS